MLKSDPRSSVGLREVAELEDRIEKIKHAYDVYFAGLDHIDPSDKKIRIRQIIAKLHEMHIKNPAVRFRFQSLVGRFVSLNQYWTRIQREIEEGRFQRSMFRSAINQPDKPKAFFGKEPPKIASKEENAEHKREDLIGAPQEKDKTRRLDIRATTIDEKDMKNLSHKRPLAGPSVEEKSATATSQTPSPEKSGCLNSGSVDRIYQEYNQARRQTGASGVVSKQALQNELDRQVGKLRKTYKDHDIDFKVVEKNGKVVLKPVVKKNGA